MKFEQFLLFLTIAITMLYTVTIFIRSKNIFFRSYLIGMFITYLMPFIIFEYFLYNEKYIYIDVSYKIIGLLIICISNLIIFICSRSENTKNYKTICGIRSGNTNLKAKKYLFLICKIYANLIGLYAIFLLLKNITYIQNNDILRLRVTPLIYKVTFTGILNNISLIVSLIYLIWFLNKKTKYYFLKFIYYYVLEICITFTLGQRTPIVVNIIILGLVIMFYYKDNKARQINIFCIIMLISSFILLYYSNNFKRTLMDSENLILNIINGDIDLNWTLWYTIKENNLFYNNILPYFMAGLIYMATIWIPRSIWLGKGYLSASWFTKSYLEQNFFQFVNIHELSWGYKFGVLQDFMINFGYIGCIFYGIIIGLIFKLSEIKSRNNIILKAYIVTVAFRISFNDIFVNIIYNIVPLILIVLFCSFIDTQYNERNK